MPSDNLTIIIPMAGYGTRLRPHTWSKPKPLVSAGGQTFLAHVLDFIAPAADPKKTEVVFIVGHLGEQVPPYMEAHHPDAHAHYLVQKEMKGQSHAIAMAREFLHGPTLIIFPDTLITDDLAALRQEPADAVIWVKPVEDPRRFGVVVTDADGYVTGLVEKPDTMEHNLAIVGYYYFKRGEDLLAAIDRQLQHDMKTKGEYFIADAIGLMLKDGLHLRAQPVDVWLDIGLPETLLETNRYLLEHGRDNSAEQPARPGVEIVPPVFIHPEARITGSRVGPHVAIGAGCHVEDSRIADSVLESGARVRNARLSGSLIGQRASVEGVDGIINVGDDSTVKGPSQANR
ncbi:MAG: nucleotidyltransferase [Chloroflexi bacterium]|nr:nucleotidyltransferase [Chloroflexota bacterium]